MTLAMARASLVPRSRNFLEFCPTPKLLQPYSDVVAQASNGSGQVAGLQSRKLLGPVPQNANTGSLHVATSLQISEAFEVVSSRSIVGRPALMFLLSPSSTAMSMTRLSLTQRL